MRTTRRFAWGVVLGGLILAPRARAAEDPAFPAPIALMKTDDATVLALNVGLMVKRSEDPAWSLSCAPDPAGDVLGYRSDPAEPNTILAVLHTGVAVTRDLGCTWKLYKVPQGQLLDAGFEGDRPSRIWQLVAIPGALMIELRDFSGNSAPETFLLPPDLDVEGIAVGGAGDHRRLYVAAYESQSGSSLLLEIDRETRRSTRHVIAEETFERPRIVFAAQESNALTVRLMGSLEDRLAFTADARAFSFSPRLGGFARAVWRNGSEGHLVAVRAAESHVLLRLDARGEVTDATPMTFATRGIYGESQHLSALAYALDDSPPLYESTDLGRTWSPVVRLSQARLRSQCAAVNRDCATGCMQLATAGLVSVVACGVEPVDGGSVKSEAPSGCALTMTTPRSDAAFAIAMAAFQLAVAVRWRYRRPRGHDPAGAALRRDGSTHSARGG
jgi:hypothetical protein